MKKERLFQKLRQEYVRTRPRSEQRFREISSFQIRGGSHNLRLFPPFPFYDSWAGGSQIRDLDGHTYVDFWQGHFGNILGHNPPVVLDALTGYFREEGQGLATGFPGIYQGDLARLILSRMGGGKIRFTTSGTLATMYAIMLARSFTCRDMVLKIGGGWHGAQPYVLKGISVFREGLAEVESAGIPSELSTNLVVSEFNNIPDLEQKFIEYGDRIACLIMEPFIGAGGFLFGEKQYIARARELTQKYGAVLIFDEVVSGFRFHAGPLQSLYGVEADLTVFGKAIGGGMPVSALAGKSEIMELCDPSAPPNKRVKFEGGTFSAHPSCMLAGLRFLEYLIENEDQIYPRLGRLGNLVRTGIEEIFGRQGFNVRCTGKSEDTTIHSSVIGVHFLRRDIEQLTSPEQVWDPEISDFELRENIFKLAMLMEGFNTFHGFGTISHAHSEQEVKDSLEAVERIARQWREYLD
ncbi:MAG: aspartate aminotransferase family protein [Candidatus Aminicenantaceae bacterium]